MSSEECENDETRQVEIKLSTVEQYLKDMSLKNWKKIQDLSNISKP